MNKTMRYLISGLLVLVLISLKPEDKIKITADNSKSSIGYAMKHPLHDFDAGTKDFKAIAVYDTESNRISAIAVRVMVKSFDSGNSNRDSHMLEVTEALKYPVIVFSADKIEYNGETVKAKGDLTFHGVKREVEISGKQNLAKGLLTLSGNFKVDMTDFGVEPPSLMGLSTDKIIDLNYMFAFRL